MKIIGEQLGTFRDTPQAKNCERDVGRKGHVSIFLRLQMGRLSVVQ